ncbi:MAG: amylo-alpha-1,6-glucosidase [Alphaproteobacteria bacterium]
MKSESSTETNPNPPAGVGGQFYIPATEAVLERRPRTLKNGDMFGVFDHHGDIVRTVGGADGIYYKDTRYLSEIQLLIDDRKPLLLSSTVRNNNALLTANLTNPDIFSHGELRLPRDTIHVVRSKFLWQGACYERIKLQNFHDVKQVIKIKINFAADFVDIFEVRGHVRPARGRDLSTCLADNAAILSYEGLDNVQRRTTISFEPKPDHIDTQSATFNISLLPRERISLFVTLACDEDGDTIRTARQFFVCLREARRELCRCSKRMASVETSNPFFTELLCRSVADYQMLVTDTEHGPYPYAGIPWFSTAFGRDGIITAMQLLWIDPDMARGVLRFLAAHQAKNVDPANDAEPGKILHEMRQGEMAALGEVPFGLYYGSVDATPLFVVLAGMYYERTGDLETITNLWPNIEAALDWIDRYGDRDGDGFVEYERQGPSGLGNQGWKDSHDAIFHADGRLATGPIALCEVQGYVYAAKTSAAGLAREIGFAAMASTLEHEAEALQEKFEAVFWSDELSSYVLALDGDKRPCAVRASNAGHALFTGIASPEHAAKVADLLMGHRFLTGWGIRTIAESEARYNPMSYHNGSVWPHDNALIALGFARYGFTDHVQRLFASLFDATLYMDLRRLPELFCGFRRVPAAGPTFYPVACSPQAWAGAAPLALLQACLGLKFDHRNSEIRFDRPRLPGFVGEVLIRALQIGDSRLDILLRKHQTDVALNVLSREGDGQVKITL